MAKKPTILEIAQGMGWKHVWETAFGMCEGYPVTTMLSESKTNITVLLSSRGAVSSTALEAYFKANSNGRMDRAPQIILAGIKIVLVTTDAENLKAVLQPFCAWLKSMGAVSGCVKCGDENAQFHIVDRLPMFLCQAHGGEAEAVAEERITEEMIENDKFLSSDQKTQLIAAARRGEVTIEKETEEENKEEPTGNNWLGLLGAILGGLVGALPVFYLGYLMMTFPWPLGLVTGAIGGSVLPVCIFFGFYWCKGKVNSRAMLPIVLTISGLIMLFCWPLVGLDMILQSEGEIGTGFMLHNSMMVAGVIGWALSLRRRKWKTNSPPAAETPPQNT